MTVEAKSESLHWNFSTTLQCRLEAQEDLRPGNASWGGLLIQNSPSVVYFYYVALQPRQLPVTVLVIQ